MKCSLQTPLNQTWDLDVIFPGGSESAEFAVFLDRLEQDTALFRAKLASAEPPQTEGSHTLFVELLGLLQDLLVRFREAESFVGCLAAENQNDQRSVQLAGRIKTRFASFLSGLARFDHLLTLMPDPVFESLLGSEPFREVAFSLRERRSLAKEKLPPEQEALINDLAVDGYHGWSDAYDTAVRHFDFPYEDEEGKKTSLSVGQASNKLHNSDRSKRAKLFGQWEESWAKQADYCADALNHLAGFRLQVYGHRGWESVHKEPLAINRMSAKTLDAMWGAIERSKPVFVEYLKRKAKLLGLEQLAWHDVTAPIGSAELTFSYDEGAKLIVDQFRRFSPKMADFAAKAFERRWIEAEDRAGKRPGGFCTAFPIAGETRIFMTYSGTMDNVSTLAHELGHAYHQEVMQDLPALAQEYAMNVAETASTFAEMILSDAAVKQAKTDEERLVLLEDKIQRAVTFYMNIHARFLFETKFYEERQKGLVSPGRLNELMTDAQKLAFHQALSEYHPHFWAAKLHFYATDVPFYNFPYTFGFLFSMGIYAEALRQGKAFEDKYAALLRDTGRMTVEELARKHLGVDLESPDFWESAVQLTVDDVKQFLELTQ